MQPLNFPTFPRAFTLRGPKLRVTTNDRDQLETVAMLAAISRTLGGNISPSNEKVHIMNT